MMPPPKSDIGDFNTTMTHGTFGFLPKFSAAELRAQITYIIANGWTPAVEHERPGRAFERYWTMWKLPLFGEKDSGRVLAELQSCRRAYPDHHIRLVGYDNHAQSQGACFVVYEGRA